MTKDELINRLKGYEWTDFECKKARRDVPKDAYTTVSAFANTEGGWLLFGISEENGQLQVTGVDVDAFDRLQDAFLTTLRSAQKLNHIISAEPHVHELDGKRILLFFIPENPRHQKPVYLNGNPRDSYIRRAARDERVTNNELQRFIRDASVYSWDSEPLEKLDAQTCLDVETIKWYQSQFYRRNSEQLQINDPIEFLQEWNFIVDQGGKPLLTRAAVLLFGTNSCVRNVVPRAILDYQRIDAHFDEWSIEERWHDRVIFEENLFKTWQGLVTKYTRLADHPFKLDPTTLRRTDDPPDYVAFREASINLLIHQDYGDHYRKASVKLFTDCTVFWNPGDALATQDEMLESTEKEVRNPLLVTAFRRIGLSDQAGTGIRAIYRNWHDLGHRPPKLINDKAAKSFELTLNKTPLITEAIKRFQSTLGVHLSPEQAEVLALAAEQTHITVIDAATAVGANFRIARDSLNYLVHQQLLLVLDNGNYALTVQIRARLDAITEQSALKSVIAQPVSVQDQKNGQVTGQVTGQVDEWVLKVLDACQIIKKSKEIQLITGIKHRETFQRNYLDLLLKRELLVRTIPDKPQSRLQGYQTTEKGRALLSIIRDNEVNK